MKTTLNTAMVITCITLATMQISQAQPTTLDPGFGDGGALVSPNVNTLNFQDTYGIREMSDGYYLGLGNKGVNLGFLQIRMTLMKYDICGIPDSAFGINGLSSLLYQDGIFLEVFDAQELPDGKILCAGRFSNNGAVSTMRPVLVRLLPDGTIDTSYGSDGAIVVQVQNPAVSSGSFGNMIKVPGDALIASIGRFPSVFGGQNGVGLMRILADGSPDEAFGPGGVRVYNFANMGSSGAQDIVHLANDGTYLLTRAESPDGGITYRAVVYAFDTSGEVLTEFGTNGRYEHPTNINNIGSRGIHSTIDAQGRLVIASNQQVTVNGQTVQNMIFIRMHANGSLDTSFGDNGTSTILSTVPTFFGINSRNLSTDADGGILAIYISRFGNSTVASAMVKLDNQGSLIPGGQILYPQTDMGITGLIQIDDDRWLAQAYSSGAVKKQSQLRFSNNPIVLPTIEESGNNLTANGSAPDFQWFLDGEAIPDATEALFTPSATGIYTVQMTDALGCQHISDAFELMELSVAENQTGYLQLLKNPVQERLILHNDLGEMKFEIYNLLGQRVTSGLLINGFNTINVLGLNQGIYLLRTVHENATNVKRFMKL